MGRAVEVATFAAVTTIYGAAVAAFDEASFEQLTGLLYETVTDDSAWARAVAMLKASDSISSASFGFLDTDSGQQMPIYGDCDATYAQLFVDRQIGNPLLPAVVGAAVGDAVIDGMLMSRGELVRSTFYNEWLRPQDEHSVLTVALWRNNSAGAHLSFLRGGRQDAFDGGDIDSLSRLLPTLRRVAALRVAIGAGQLSRLAEENDSSGTGMLVVDEHSRILTANAASEGFLSDPGTGLHAPAGRLKAAGRVRERLRRAVHAACSDGYDDVLSTIGDMMIADRDSGAPLAVLSVLPLRNAPALGLPVGRAALVLLRRLAPSLPDGFTRRLRNLFELTPREAELGASLARGGSLQDFAIEAAISLATARSQLAAVFRKTGTSRQGELVALLHRVGRPT